MPLFIDFIYVKYEGNPIRLVSNAKLVYTGLTGLFFRRNPLIQRLMLRNICILCMFYH